MTEVKKPVRAAARRPRESRPTSPSATSSTSTSTKSPPIRCSRARRRSTSRRRSARATRTPSRSSSSATCASSSPSRRSTRTAASPSSTSSAKATSACSPPRGSSIPDQGVKFISYAVWWIRQAILSALARQGRTVRVPLNRTADLSRIIKASEILRQKLNREPSPEELSMLTGLSVDVVQSLAALNTSDVRLDAPMDPEGDRSLIERFVADEMPDTEEEAMNRFLTDEIEQALVHAAAARRQGAAPLLRPRRRTRAHARGNRQHARRHPRAGPPAARPRPQAPPRRRRRPRTRQLRRVNGTSSVTAGQDDQRTGRPHGPPRSVVPDVRPRAQGLAAGPRLASRFCCRAPDATCPTGP